MDFRKDFVMTIKLIGVIFVVLSCGGVGFKMAHNHRQEEKALGQLIGILDYMECELQYRLTPLPILCRQASLIFKEMPGQVFEALSAEIDTKSAADICECMETVLAAAKSIPAITKKELELLGQNLGRFDLEGQLKGLEAVRQDCIKNLTFLSDNRENRLRSYQTLGLCAGAALAILLV